LNAHLFSAHLAAVDSSFNGASEEAAERTIVPAESLPQALKRGRKFGDLAARVKLVPFPIWLELDFFRNLSSRALSKRIQTELRCLLSYTRTKRLY
jgi:hypothetical protein